jgi:hypothetical protein
MKERYGTITFHVAWVIWAIALVYAVVQTYRAIFP